MKWVFVFLALASFAAVSSASARDIVVIPVLSPKAERAFTGSAAVLVGDLLTDVAAEAALKAAREHGPLAVRALKKYGPAVLALSRDYAVRTVALGEQYALRAWAAGKRYIPNAFIDRANLGPKSLGAGKKLSHKKNGSDGLVPGNLVASRTVTAGKGDRQTKVKKSATGNSTARGPAQ
jgi:hypothetical protein